MHKIDKEISDNSSHNKTKNDQVVEGTFIKVVPFFCMQVFK